MKTHSWATLKIILTFSIVLTTMSESSNLRTNLLYNSISTSNRQGHPSQLEKGTILGDFPNEDVFIQSVRRKLFTIDFTSPYTVC